MDAGADDYMEKPVNRDLLKVRLRVAERMLRLGTEVKALKDLIPVCSHCRRVRRDDQAYESLELYISKNSSVRFSHGICPECLVKHYPHYK
jgi:DNA-binding response OmpR family regulator